MPEKQKTIKKNTETEMLRIMIKYQTLKPMELSRGPIERIGYSKGSLSISSFTLPLIVTRKRKIMKSGNDN